jgi:glycosyltransferase involved in cell wall biosynthesis
MNIGIDIKALFKGKAGIAVYIAKTLDRLQEIDTQNNYFLFEKHPSSYRIVNPLWKRVVVPSRLPGTLWLLLKIPFCFRKYSLDVFWGPEQIAPCVVPSRGVAVVSTVLDVAVRRYPRTMQTSNYFINALFLGQSIRRSRTVLTISHVVKNDICRFYPGHGVREKVMVTYPGKPDWNIPGDRPGTSGNHLLFVGSFEPRKNLLNLLRALLICKTEKHTVVPLRVVGPGGWKNNRMKKFIGESGLSSQVSISGYVGEESLIKEYCSCRAFVYPSLYEGFGLPVLESLMAGTLVLTSRGTAMEEIAGTCCLLFDPNDPLDIARTILTAYDVEFKPETILKNRKDVLERYSWDDTARQTLEALKAAGQRF